jgi:hypothetical protein
MTRHARLIVVICLVTGSLYFAKAIYRGLTFTTGDYYFTLSGEYVRRLNPALWNSPDVQASIAYNHGTYLYGPSQYLALYPIVFLDSYRSIALTLLGLYSLVLIAAWYGLSALLGPGDRTGVVLSAVVFAVVFAFLPLSQALIQREFEVVTFLLLVLACVSLVRGREITSGALVAAATWFKYWPIILLGTFVLHRRVKGLVAFAAVSAAILLTAQLVFGLQHFMIGRTAGLVGGLVRPLGSGEALYPVIPRGAAKSDFCRQWVGGRGTAADVRWMLCAVEDRVHVLNARAAYYLLAAATGALYLWGAVRLERSNGDGMTAQWGVIWEFAVLLIAGASFVHAHYYYYIVFLLPLCALLYAYLAHPQRWRRTKLSLWAATYLLLNALMLPMSWLSGLWQVDAWSWYIDSGVCVAGIVLLLALVLWEFTHLTRHAPRALAAA